jgi:hypothetical protein
MRVKEKRPPRLPVDPKESLWEIIECIEYVLQKV